VFDPVIVGSAVACRCLRRRLVVLCSDISELMTEFGFAVSADLCQSDGNSDLTMSPIHLPVEAADKPFQRRRTQAGRLTRLDRKYPFTTPGPRGGSRGWEPAIGTVDEKPLHSVDSPEPGVMRCPARKRDNAAPGGRRIGPSSCRPATHPCPSKDWQHRLTRSTAASMSSTWK